MKRYFAVEVIRTITERRKVYLCAEDADVAHDDALYAADNDRRYCNQWGEPYTQYEIASKIEIDQPERVDVAV